MGKILFAVGILLLFGVTSDALAQQGRDEADRLEKMRDRASAREQELQQEVDRTQNEIAQIQSNLVSVARRIGQQNDLSIEAEEHLLGLEQEETGKTQALLGDQEALAEILAALQRSGMSPPPPLAVSPNDTLAAARASMLLGAIVPELRERADALKNSLIELQHLRAQIKGGKEQLDLQMRALADEQAALQVLLDKRQQLEVRLRSRANLASKEVKSLGERAANVRELIRQLEIEASKTTPSIKPKPPSRQIVLAPSIKPQKRAPGVLPPAWNSPTARFADSRGQLDIPVAGKVLWPYGQAADPNKVAGLVLQTARRAQIIAPYDGRIAFVGNFRNFGQLMILDVGEGYHMVLSGLAKAYVVKGQSVLAGEPIGKMADRRKPPPEFYLEFRKQGQPFDPTPWLKKDIKPG